MKSFLGYCISMAIVAFGMAKAPVVFRELNRELQTKQIAVAAKDTKKLNDSDVLPDVPSPPAPTPTPAPKPPTPSPAPKTQTKLMDLVTKATKENKNVVLFFGGKNCPYCRDMSRDVLPASKNPDFLVFDIDTGAECNQDITEEYCGSKIPCYVMVDKNGKVLKRSEGYRNLQAWETWLDSTLISGETLDPRLTKQNGMYYGLATNGMTYYSANPKDVIYTLDNPPVVQQPMQYFTGSSCSTGQCYSSQSYSLGQIYSSGSCSTGRCPR